MNGPVSVESPLNGAMDFSVTGVAAALTYPLAAAGIPLLLVATFETDYRFVRADRLPAACAAIVAAGCRVEDAQHSDAAFTADGPTMG